jgi:beta-N-acetylhexosaminidase
MEGASAAGGIVARARAALTAGCDMVLVCNRPDLADELLRSLNWRADRRWQERLTRMRARGAYLSLADARADRFYQAALSQLQHSRPSVASPAGDGARG